MKRLSGLYFVFDIGRGGKEKFVKLERAIEGGVDIVQMWSEKNFDGVDRKEIRQAKEITQRRDVPLIVNNNLDLAIDVGADGVHMDGYEMDARSIRERFRRKCFVGYTVGDDLRRVKWAETVGADYISFCAIYPSQSVSQCEIVPLETVKKARRITSMPIFASGGINLRNAADVMRAGANGIAVISAIQNAEDPEGAAREFKKVIFPFATA